MSFLDLVVFLTGMTAVSALNNCGRLSRTKNFFILLFSMEGFETLV
jgi:hypothetical protein